MSKVILGLAGVYAVGAGIYSVVPSRPPHIVSGGRELPTIKIGPLAMTELQFPGRIFAGALVHENGRLILYSSERSERVVVEDPASPSLQLFIEGPLPHVGAPWNTSYLTAVNPFKSIPFIGIGVSNLRFGDRFYACSEPGSGTREFEATFEIGNDTYWVTGEWIAAKNGMTESQVLMETGEGHWPTWELGRKAPELHQGPRPKWFTPEQEMLQDAEFAAALAGVHFSSYPVKI